MQCGTERCVGAFSCLPLPGRGPPQFWRLPHRGMGRRRIDSAIPSPSRRRRRVWQMADGFISDRRGRSGVARSSVASVKPVFAQATLGTHWALIPRQNLEDSRFASLTVDTQHHGKDNRAQRFARFGGQEAEDRVGGVGAGWRRVGRGFFFLARLQACHSSTQSFLAVQRSRSTNKYHPVEALTSLNHTQSPKSPDSQATCRLTQVATDRTPVLH